MPTITRTIQMHQRDRGVNRHRKGLLLGLGCSGLISLLLAAVGITITLGYADLTSNLPSVDILPELLEPPDGLLMQPTRFYDRTGQQLIFSLQNPNAGDRAYLSFTGVQDHPEGGLGDGILPSSLITATIISTDPDIWVHPGFSLSGLISSEHKQTLAEQLASNLLLDDEPPGLRRRLRESILAAQITNRFGREKVIEWYLNSAYYGKLAYGAQAAAKLYFDKPAWELDFSEAAVLAATAENPSMNPIDAPAFVLERQREIVREALRTRMLPPSEAIQAFREIPKINLNPDEKGIQQEISLSPGIDPVYATIALDQLTSRISQQDLERGGLRIFTTLDYDLQSQVACTIQVQRERLGNLQSETPSATLADCPAARLLPSHPIGMDHPIQNLALESVILDPLSGQILALSSSDANKSGSVSLSRHPAGSLSTIFIYLTGFTRSLSPGSLVWDIPSEEEPSKRINFDNQYHGPVRLRIAFANDYLTPAQNVLSQVGVENVLRTTQQLGIQFPQSSDQKSDSLLSIFRPLDLLEISYALGTFANHGTLTGHAFEGIEDIDNVSPASYTTLPPLEPTTILKAEKLTGDTIFDWSQPQERPILTPQLSYLITHVLSDETARWPSLGHPNPLEIGRPSATKISSSMNADSNWVIGYTPKRLIGVWLGKKNPAQNPIELSPHDMRAHTAELWHAIAQYAEQNLPYEDFQTPTGIDFVQVCDPSGLLPTAACPNVVDEVFLNGNEPVQIDTLYRLVSINRDTGELATIFTPPDLIEQRSYLSLPPDAADWAVQTGLDIPPNNYDVLPAQTSTWIDTNISTPAMFDHLHGNVSIMGSADGPGFFFYRLQYGKGPNPSEWFQIGENSQQPVTNGLLGSWNTEDLDGLYAVQLLTIRNNKNVERATVLVSIDNQPPLLEITRPLEADTISISDRSKIVLQTEVSDNLQIDQVIFKMDGQSIATLMQPPFAISWKLSPGKHTFQVIATDTAGNSSEDRTSFTVK
jgi:membrane peptidoglycan carboxypeptidase